MKALFTLLLVLAGCTQKFEKQHQVTTRPVTDSSLHDGDIIFQTSRSAQSIAVQQATHSPYSHCGLIVKRNGNWYVLEAVQPVKFTVLDKWIERGKGGDYIIKRLINADKILTPSATNSMDTVANTFISKDYDIYFGWDDDKIYCSELIWKIYKRSIGISIGNTQKLRDMDLSGNVVKQKMFERYKNKVPLNDTVITPVAIFNSPLLTTVSYK